MLLLALSLALAAAPPGTRADETRARFPKGLTPMELGPPPAPLADWSQATCAKCHPREAEAWSHSGHATARTNYVFQAALTRDDPAWCLRCHAPLAKSTANSVGDDAPAEERGVTCAACHAGHEAVVAPSASKADHALEVVPHAGGSALCAQCHEFGFPVHDAHRAMVGLTRDPPQQDTFGEWTRWQAKGGDGRGCLDCHQAHDFGGVRRVDALASAIRVEPSARALTVSLRDVGHAFPTGDVMRWLTVEAASEPLFESPVELARFGRELGLTTDLPPHRTVVRDRRLEPGTPAQIAVPERDAQGRPLVAWRLVYHLVSLEQEATGMLSPPSSRVVLQSGYLPAEKGK